MFIQVTIADLDNSWSFLNTDHIVSFSSNENGTIVRTTIGDYEIKEKYYELKARIEGE